MFKKALVKFTEAFNQLASYIIGTEVKFYYKRGVGYYVTEDLKLFSMTVHTYCYTVKELVEENN